MTNYLLFVGNLSFPILGLPFCELCVLFLVSSVNFLVLASMVLLRNIIGSAYATPQVKLYWQPFAECLREYVYDNGWNLGGNRSIGYSFGEIYNILLLHIPCRGVHTNEVCVPEDLPNSGFNM